MATDTVAINVRKVGVFGGTFDPVHRAHVALALAVKKTLTLDEVRFVPCGNLPHRDLPVASDADRLAMLAHAIDNRPDLMVDDWELSQTDTTYTYKTLMHLSQPGKLQLFFLMGLDSLQQFTSWRNWRGILELCHLAVVRRPGLDLQGIPNELAAHVVEYDASSSEDSGHIYVVDFDEMPISATRIRRQLQQNTDVGDSIEPAVLHYIKERRLYQNV